MLRRSIRIGVLSLSEGTNAKPEQYCQTPKRGVNQVPYVPKDLEEAIGDFVSYFTSGATGRHWMM